MSPRVPALSRPRSRARRPARSVAADLDATTAAAERDAVIVWRGERISFEAVPARIARTDGRAERHGLYAGWIEALEAMNPRYRARLAGWRQEDVGVDAEADPLDLERLVLHSETVYYAALRRYLAVIDIEQGDATLADLWHVERGAGWGHWFGARDAERAAGDAGRHADDDRGLEGWRAAEARLFGPGVPSGTPAAAVAELYASLVGDPSWLDRALRIAPDEIAAFADFAAFIRLWRIRHQIGLMQFELRLAGSDEDALQRAYYAGIVGNMIGISVPEAAYLYDLGHPGSAGRALDSAMLAGAMAERLENRYGAGWWADARARQLVDELGSAASVEDVLARLGYDAIDWRPLMRQIRTRLIGEMSGYGGPNITTRAGTRKV